ncbi:hypothetical protein [Bernardetia sp.]|uniref:hypothetical protein n=1 Tax=Bernardetia sp. TaxID=1937974 RepID=UPI0025BD0B85|nr:hypothetical protein [Bernardetia sp.]
MKIYIENEAYFFNLKTNEGVERLLHQLESFCGELWIEKNEEDKLCILLNETRIYLMYLKENESLVIFQESKKHNHQTEEFTLSNGQLDEYHLYNTLQRNKLEKVIKIFCTLPSSNFIGQYKFTES